MNGDDGSPLDAHGLTTTSNLEETRGGSADAQAEKGVFQVCGPGEGSARLPGVCALLIPGGGGGEGGGRQGGCKGNLATSRRPSSERTGADPWARPRSPPW